jgi:SAM-dependent methyltransferase
VTDSASDWKKAIIAAMNGWRCEDDVVVSPQLLTPEAGYRDIDYESILLDPYRTVTAEYPFYVKSVSTALAKIGFTKHPYVADLGCGDGRFVRWLLNAGQEHVIGMDISRPNLHRLRERIRAIPGANDKVLLVEGDIAQPPLPKASVDLAMAVGVLFMLDKDYAKGVAAAG